MSVKLQYSVLRYSPSIISGESINLGILFSTETVSLFEYTKKFTRVHEFDDTLDIDILKFMLASIKEDVDGDLTTINRNFSIENYIRFYCKEYHFSAVNSIISDDVSKTIEEIKRIYLRFDYDVSQRPSNKDELLFLRSLLSNKGSKVQARKTTTGEYDEMIRFDFVVGDYGIKYFSLGSEKDLKKIMNDIKAWAWNCEHFKSICPVIVYNTDITDVKSPQYKDFQSIMNILNSASQFIVSLDEVSAKLNLVEPAT